MPRKSYRVKFDGGSPGQGGTGAALAGIIDRPDPDALALLAGQPSAPERSVPVAVFSHCFTCNKDLKAIVRIARGMAEAGIAVLRFDMTGLGGSEGEFSKTDFTTNIADLKAAIEFAADEIGPVTALVGHSFGGAASLAVAGEMAASDTHPAAVVSLAAPSDTTHLATLLESMAPTLTTTGTGSVSIGGRSWSVRREMVEDFRRHDLPALIAKIRSKTLIFHSPVDRTVSFDHAIRILGLIQSSGQSDRDAAAASLVTLAGADHLLVENAADIELVTSMSSAFLLRYASDSAVSV